MTKADWLRSEIEKLEGMKLDAKISRSLGQDRTVYGIERHNTALTSIITRHKEELKVLESK